MRFVLSILILSLLVACIPSALGVEQIPLDSSGRCSGRFVAHELPHVTAASVERVAFFVSNGAGLAVNDLDGDGDMDLLLPNLLGPNHIYWNEGSWQFREEILWDGSAHAAAIVDVDGDDRLDIVLTSRLGRMRYWHNIETAGTAAQFVEERLPGVDAYAYSMSWGDLDGDGDLDLVAASYDATLEKQLGALYRERGNNGVFVYENSNGQFSAERLANQAQALALELVDLDGDGRRDIIVGNDFDVPDQVWLAGEEGWEAGGPFATTTMSTMSFDVGDINNDGQRELFATDMHPYSDAPPIMDQWRPVMEAMHHDMAPDDPQQMENVLQLRDASGQFVNDAVRRGVAASGWSWSSKFGDLNQDGYLDIYVVNGMQALDIFSHLPNDQLVEENQAYRNDGEGHFEPAPDWGLNSIYGGRGMSMADLDNDGDLDIIVNNLRAPAQLFENQLCQGAGLLVDLRWPDSGNSRAIGAALRLHTSSGTYVRDVRAISGYLSGDPSRVHFGFPAESELQRLEILWPDGEVSVVEELRSNRLIRVERNR